MEEPLPKFIMITENTFRRNHKKQASGLVVLLFSKDQSLEKMEQDAKSQKLGLWQDSNAVSIPGNTEKSI